MRRPCRLTNFVGIAASAWRVFVISLARRRNSWSPASGLEREAEVTRLLGFSTLALIVMATPSFAGLITGAPAPLLGAGLPGLAVLAVTGVGYLAVRARPNRKD
jgi:hypothetical protein